MNNKFYLGLVLLVFLLLFSLFAGHWVQHRQAEIKNCLSAAMQVSDPQEGLRLVTQANRQWQSIWKGIASFSHHNVMEEIDRLFSQLSVCADDRQEFLLCSAQLCSLLDALSNDHIFTWWNLL